MKIKTLLIVLILTFILVRNSYTEIENIHGYIIRDADYWKVKKYIIYPCVNMKLKNEYEAYYECTTNVSMIGIYVEIDGEMMWKDRRVKIGKPEENGKYNYYIYFEIIDSLGNNVCKKLKKAVIERDYEIRKSTLFIFLKKSFINKLKEGKYKLKTILYEKKGEEKYNSSISFNDDYVYDSDFVFMNVNNPIIRDSEASFFAWTGWAMFERNKWRNGKNKYIRKTAEELLTKSVELNTNLRFVYRDLIGLLLQEKKYKEIIKVLDKWVKVRNKLVIFYYDTVKIKSSPIISKKLLREILKEVYGDKAEEKIKKYYSEGE